MFRDNLFGVVLLGASAVVAAVIIWQMVAGERLRYSGPSWLAWALGIVMIGGILYALFDRVVRKNDRQWPNPGAGQKSLLDRIRGKNGQPGPGGSSE